MFCRIRFLYIKYFAFFCSLLFVSIFLSLLHNSNDVVYSSPGPEKSSVNDDVFLLTENASPFAVNTPLTAAAVEFPINISSTMGTLTTHSRELFEAVKVVKLELKPIPNSHFTILSAYYDDRKSFHRPCIIVLGHNLRKMWSEQFYCNMHYSDGSKHCLKKPSKVELANTCNKYLQYTTKASVFLICEIPSSIAVPTYISLSSERDCSKDSVKQLVENREKPVSTKEFGVCVQTPLYGKETLQNIYEFIEVHKLLGVQMFTFYAQIKLDEFTSALQIYKDVSIELVEWSDSFRRTYPVHYFGEVLSIHDCLYRNMHKAKYLAFVDLDEVITPLQDQTWTEMFARLPSVKINGYAFVNALMVTHDTVSKRDLTAMQRRLCSTVKVPKYLKISKKLSCIYEHPRRSKIVVFPEKVSHLDIHSICNTRNGFHKMVVPRNVSLLYHYRKTIPPDCKNRTMVDAKEWTNRKNELLTHMFQNLC